MGARGPVAKRSEESRRHDKPAGPPLVKAPGAAAVPVPTADPQWHAVARRWFEALAESGQSRFYEPSDWAVAEYVAEAMSRNLKQGQRFSANLFAAVMSAMSELLTTEGSRRRVRVELQRNQNGAAPDGAPPAGVTALHDYRNALGG